MCLFRKRYEIWDNISLNHEKYKAFNYMLANKSQA
jgi:hypothetical protein